MTEKAKTNRPIMVVTGGGRGIGAAIARQAARAGYAVCVNYVRNGDAAATLLREILKEGGEAIAVQADVGVQHEATHLFEQTDALLGRVDVLVNNAGVLGNCRVADMDEAALDSLFRANVYSMFFCAREAVRRMSTRLGGPGGVIVNLSSVASRLGGLPGGSHYAASKGAIDTFTLALAKEVGAEGIRVNALRPGLIHTDIHEIHGGATAVDTLGSTTPMGRAGSADEVAEAALWLASAQASYVHGAILDVAGGR